MTTNSAKIQRVNSVRLVDNEAPAEMRVESETIDCIREPPPPYTVSGTLEVNPQPIIQQTVIIQQPLKYNPIIYTCGVCGETILTKVDYVNTRKTHMCAGFICGCTFWCLMCCLGAIPYILPICKKVKHYCPNCENLIGEYSKI